MSEIYTFTTLFIEQLNDLYSAEKQLADVMPQIIDVTSSGELREVFEDYQDQVRSHLSYIEKMYNDLRSIASNKVCKAIEGIIEESEDVIRHGGNSAVKDASLIAILQRLQHYKIAVYGTARSYARYMDPDLAVDLHNLQRALNDESIADKRLTKLAEGGMFTTGINEEAAKASRKIKSEV